MSRWCFVPGAAVAGWLLATLPLLLLGWYRPLPATVLGLAGAGAAAGVVLRRAPSGPPWPRWVPLALLVVAGATVVLGAATHGEQVVVVRDAGTYANSGSWIAEHGSLRIPGDVEAFGGPVPGLALDSLNLDSPGFFQVGDNLVPQFLPGLPALLAVGRWVGGWTGLFCTPALLTGLAVLAFGGLVARLVRPSYAPLGALLLAATYPVLDTARQTLSEGPSTLLLLSGLGLLVRAADAGSRRLGLLSGLLLGTACLVRVDALREVLLMVAVLGWWWARGHRVAGDAAVGLASGTAAGVGTAFLVSRPYLHEIRGSFLPLLAVLALGSALAVPAAALARTHPGLLPPIPRALPVLAGAVTVVLLVALALRPVFMTVRQVGSKATSDIAALQRFEGLRVDGTRTYSEHSVSWVAWWSGWPLVIGAVVAAGWVAWQATAGRRPRLGAVLVVLVGSAVATLARPAITPDHPWADRRLVPTVLPALVLLAVAGLAELSAWRPAALMAGRRRALVVAVACVVLAAPAFVASAALVFSRTEVGQPAALEAVCRRLEPRDAVLFVDREPRSQWLQAIRGECGVPTASVVRPTADRVSALVARVRAAGYRPVLATTTGARQLAARGSPAEQVVDLATTQHGRTLMHRPSRVWALHNRLWLGVPDGR